jgi:prepilin peptidase CpaA
VRVLVILPNVLLVATLLVSCYTDLKKRKVLNVVVFPAAVLALVLQLLLQGGAGALFWLKGTLAGIGLLFIPFACGGIGAGDVKLLGVVGAFKGAGFAFWTFLCAALLGGLFALLFLIKRKELRQTVAKMGGALKLFLFSCFRVWNMGELDEEKERATIPYGVAIALGSLLCLAGELL